MPYQTVQSVCKRDGIDPSHAPLGFGNDLRKQAIAEVMSGEKTVAEVAATFEMSHGHLMRLMNEQGLSVGFAHKR